VLADSGFTADEIEDLAARGVIAPENAGVS
jgi:hypothetical protein